MLLSYHTIHIIEIIGTFNPLKLVHPKHLLHRISFLMLGYSNMPIEERAKLNFDHPEALETSLLIEHLTKLRYNYEFRIFTHY